MKEFQFYDWFAGYSQPTDGRVWANAWNGTYPIELDTIATYIDEIHRQGGRAWAYVQSVAAAKTDGDLSDDAAGIYKLIDKYDEWLSLGPFNCYFLNAEWANHQAAVWAPTVRNLQFDGIHWDTLGAWAKHYDAESAGVHAFLQQAKVNLASYGLIQTMNFVDLAWHDAGMFDPSLVAFPYAEIWTKAPGDDREQLYYSLMESAPDDEWGVMALYPNTDMPTGWSEVDVMLARWAETQKHRLVYLVVGDDERRLHNEYFPQCVRMGPEKAALQSSVPPVPVPPWIPF